MIEPILYERFVRKPLEEALEDTPVVLIHGPRQCGKTTLAKTLSATYYMPHMAQAPMEPPVATSLK